MRLWWLFSQPRPYRHAKPRGDGRVEAVCGCGSPYGLVFDPTATRPHSVERPINQDWADFGNRKADSKLKRLIEFGKVGR